MERREKLRLKKRKKGKLRKKRRRKSRIQEVVVAIGVKKSCSY